MNWQNRLHFFSLAAPDAPHIDRSRARITTPKEGRRGRISAATRRGPVFLPAKSGALIALDEALERLADFDSRKARVVELRYFGGMSVEETAKVLEVSANTVIRDWSLAEVWLKRELKESGVDAG
jgi:RNA polymerase sigma-70 factor (ECF subfamily)